MVHHLGFYHSDKPVTKSNGMNPRAEPWTQIPGQAPGNLTKKTHPLNPPLLPREGEAEGGGEFIKGY